ncbi:CAL67264 family membrane protein [Flavobacterium hankyongi]|uniref:CAL67264 family membrane protein n=2 Tax=Flavobacteriaceae TaxID=49546 RepID=A0ABP8ZI47_9FLAO
MSVGMNKNTVLGWATLIMILMGLLLIGLGVYRYADVAGWGFAAVGIGFLANAWVFNALKGRV